MKDDLEILYEDNHLIVVYKPYGILSQSDITNDKDMLTIVKEYIKNKYNKPGNVYLGLIHRLDRVTEGIMVFAKTSKAASRLSVEIKNNEFKKWYLLIVSGILSDKEKVIENYIKKDGNKSITSKDGKYSYLSYKVLKEKNNLSLIEVYLKTGRHHQIRVTFADINHPLYADHKYGIENGEELALCAYKISFLHPVSKKVMNFEIKPKNKVFNMMIN